MSASLKTGAETFSDGRRCQNQDGGGQRRKIEKKSVAPPVCLCHSFIRPSRSYSPSRIIYERCTLGCLPFFGSLESKVCGRFGETELSPSLSAKEIGNQPRPIIPYWTWRHLSNFLFLERTVPLQLLHEIGIDVSHLMDSTESRAALRSYIVKVIWLGFLRHIWTQKTLGAKKGVVEAISLF